MSDDIKALASRIPLEVENQGKLEVLDEVLAGLHRSRCQAWIASWW